MSFPYRSQIYPTWTRTDSILNTVKSKLISPSPAKNETLFKSSNPSLFDLCAKNQCTGEVIFSLKKINRVHNLILLAHKKHWI